MSGMELRPRSAIERCQRRKLPPELMDLLSDYSLTKNVAQSHFFSQGSVDCVTDRSIKELFSKLTQNGGSGSEELWITIGELEQDMCSIRQRKGRNPLFHNPLMKYKCYSCAEEFLVEEYYLEHMKRKTMILFMDCKHCKQTIEFENICLLKDHLLKHEGFRINYDTMIRVKVLQLANLNCPDTNTIGNSSSDDSTPKTICTSCGLSFTSLEEHLFGRNKPDPNFQCRICTYVLPTFCSFTFHLTLHTKDPPFNCPDCGLLVESHESLECHIREECFHYEKAISPYCTFCGIIFVEGEKLRCHLMTDHSSIIFKCSYCPATFSSARDSNKHQRHFHNAKNPRSPMHYHCHFCKDLIVPKKEFRDHIFHHINKYSAVTYIYRCAMCRFLTHSKSQFKVHKIEVHEMDLKQFHLPPIKYDPKIHNKSNRIDSNSTQNRQNYRRKIKEEPVLRVNFIKPVVDPFENQQKVYKCIICNLLMDLDWDSVLLHFSSLHRETKDLDPFKSVVITSFEYEKMNRPENSKTVQVVPSTSKVQDQEKPISTAKKTPRTYGKRKQRKNITIKVEVEDEDEVKLEPERPTTPENPLECRFCHYLASDMDKFRAHIVCHRPNATAFQCMECGSCFVVKNSLVIHLAYAHDITNIEEYCSQYIVSNSLLPLKEHQCSVCKEIFDCAVNLNKHLRSHGMAFLNLMKQN